MSVMLGAVNRGSLMTLFSVALLVDIPVHMLNRVDNEAYIYSRVRSEARDEKVKNMSLLTVGRLRAPPRFTFEKISDFNNLKGISEVFREVEWRPRDRQLRLQMEAFKYRANMLIRIEFYSETEAARGFEYEVISGTLTGLKGKMQIEAIPVLNSRVTLSGQYLYEKFPIPEFFLEWGLEIVLQKISAKVRSFIEGQLKAIPGQPRSS